MEAAQGLAKIVSAKDDDEVLGVHVIGPMAGELISEARARHGIFGEHRRHPAYHSRRIPLCPRPSMRPPWAVDKKAIDGINR